MGRSGLRFAVVGMGIAELFLWGASALQAGYIDVVLADGPRGYWRLGDPAAASTALNSAVTGAVLNGTYTPSKTNAGGLLMGDSDTAAAFNGTSSYISGSGISTAGSSGGNVFAADWSIEAWLVRQGVGDWQGVFSNNRGGTGAPLLTFFGYGSPAYHRLGINAAGISANGISVDLDQYGGGGGAYLGKPMYAVVTKVGGNSAGSNTILVKVNVNGQWLPSVTGSTSWNLTPQDGFYIGRHYDGGTQIMNGVLDEVAIYDAALSPRKIMAHYAAGALSWYPAEVVSSGPVAYWRLDEPAGATKALNSGWGGIALDGTYSPAKTTTAPLVPRSPWNAGAADFDGSNAHIAGSGLNTASTTGGNPFAGNWTIETWFIRDTANADWQAIFSNNADSAEGGGAPVLTFFDSSSGRSRSWLGMNPAGVAPTPDIYVDLNQYAGGNNAYLGKLVYAVLTKSGSQLNMYVNVDGQWLPSASATLARTLDTNNDKWFIGRHYWGGIYFDGKIDDVAIYDRALAWEEVLAHYTQATVPEPAGAALVVIGLGMLGMWKLLGGSTKANSPEKQKVI